MCVASFIESTVLLLIGGRTSGGPPETGYDTREYNVTDFVCQAINLITCPITYIAIIPGALGTKTLQLEAEEAHYNVDCCICNQDVRFPYGEMGEVGKCDCMCFKGVQFKGIVVCPRSGCDGETLWMKLSSSGSVGEAILLKFSVQKRSKTRLRP